ncbi:hypothetical protein KCU92_g7126, partial [Aureobasidium melanogenum]
MPCQQLIALDNRDIAIMADPSLEKKDLIALRLTSKAQGIHASATKAFGKRYFTEISLLYTEYSLETFVKICGHPVFGPCVRQVELSCVRFDSDSFDESVQNLINCGYTRKQFMDQVQRLSARCDAEDLFDASDARALLERAFAHLATSDHSLTIVISTGENGAIGHSRIYLADSYSEEFHAKVSFTLDLLLGSAKQSGCKVSKLDMTVASRWFAHSRDYDLSSLMHSISEVSLGLTFIRDDEDDEPWNFMLWMRKLLLCGTNIKILQLYPLTFDDNDDSDFEFFAEAISCLPLEELRLFDSRLHQKAMTDLSESLGSTLRCLTIDCCNISGSWREILMSIQQNCLQLGYLFIHDDNLALSRFPKVYRGVTAVRSGLEELLEAEQRGSEVSADQGEGQ